MFRVPDHEKYFQLDLHNIVLFPNPVVLAVTRAAWASS